MLQALLASQKHSYCLAALHFEVVLQNIVAGVDGKAVFEKCVIR